MSLSQCVCDTAGFVEVLFYPEIPGDHDHARLVLIACLPFSLGRVPLKISMIIVSLYPSMKQERRDDSARD